ncbi:hypothetical protein CLROS_043620 [Clostridium felsineum]|uniref:Uncharacterized protein n=1 Tax=Clostridium felsineum TaxID=36839 RepID=A0A1S8L3J0_9CLOT|nr:hypothetical protein CLROS_043620 [Clostridium felsineum]URZ09586.1 hypothetical protein CROST_002670 [Clostridium felsineum]
MIKINQNLIMSDALFYLSYEIGKYFKYYINYLNFYDILAHQNKSNHIIL